MSGRTTASSTVHRARPLLGTLVAIQLADDAQEPPALLRAVDAAFDTIAQIHRCMSAHDDASDLARLARARTGERLPVHPHTAAVLRLALGWHRASAGAFDPQAAGRRLARDGARPGLGDANHEAGSFAQLRVHDDDSVQADTPLQLDLGGIAKGYAVDQAVATLRRHGIAGGLVNAGGDLRAFGPRAWPIEVQHPAVWSRTRRLLRLRDAAVASSLGAPDNAEFVVTRRQRGARWRCSTVLARDCATADALTKWALQAPAPSLQLRATLARVGARLWRS
ncbi:MAG: FAD:protein FMN transferase [Ramlibacter sp.]